MEGKPLENRYYDISDVENNRFYQLPKALIENEKYDELHSTAKIIYAILKDRHALSVQNGWIDEKGVYFMYKDDALADLLRMTKRTANKYKKELEKYGLIEMHRTGLNQPNKIYLCKPEGVLNRPQSLGAHRNGKNVPLRSGKNVPLKKGKNVPLKSGKNVPPNDTEYSDTELNDTDINNLSISDKLKSFLIKHQDKLGLKYNKQKLQAIEELDGLIDEDSYCSIILSVLENKRIKNFKKYLLASVQNYQKDKQEKAADPKHQPVRQESLPNWWEESAEYYQQGQAEKMDPAEFEAKKRALEERLKKRQAVNG
jgi:hypothetical protein